MTPIELLESVKERFNPLLVREEETLKAFLIKALTTYQDRAGVVKTLKLEKAGATAIPLPEDYLSLVHVTDNNGLLVYSDELSGFIELELTGSERWPFRMVYLVNLRDRKLDEWQVPPAIIGMLEEYLVEINTRVEGKKSFTTELHGLKSLLDMTGKIYEAPNLCHIFLPGDIPTQRNTSTKPYSDGEVKRLNQSVVGMQEQLARAIIIHEIMGNRISETLTLKQDCLVERGPNTMVRVFMVKTQRTCEKPVPKEVVELIKKSIAYTEKKYGKREYVFVNDKKPDLPMTYDYLRYHLRVMFREEGLLDDQGRPFGMGTHRFRNTLGQRLTEMHVEDETIAQILGHSGTRSVKNYRKFGNKAMAEETKNVRESMDEVLSQLMQGW